MGWMGWMGWMGQVMDDGPGGPDRLGAFAVKTGGITSADLWGGSQIVLSGVRVGENWNNVKFSLPVAGERARFGAARAGCALSP